MRFAVLIASLMCACGLSAGPQVVWLNPSHNFGAFNEELGHVTCVFQGVNTGDEPLVVVSARANCGCTTPAYPTKPIAPGDTLRVRVQYNATGRPGKFEKAVYVTTNADDKTQILHIYGTVIGSANTLKSRYPLEVGPARINGNVLSLGKTVKGRVVAGRLTIYNPSTDTIRPVIADLPTYIHVMFSPDVLPPGEQGVASFTAYTNQCPTYGIVTDTFHFRPNTDSPDSLEVESVVILTEDFSHLTEAQRQKAAVAEYSTEILDFGRISTPASGKLTATFSLTNSGKSPLKIHRLYTPADNIEISCPVKELKPGKSTMVTVVVDPSELSPESPLNERITVITNAPDNPQQIIRVVGEAIK